MNVRPVRLQRLRGQALAGSDLRTPQDVTALLGGVQAQDRDGSLWSIGLRLPGATETAVVRAVEEHAIVRTWAMRGTQHLLAAGDVRRVVAALAPYVVADNARRYRQLGLDEPTFARSDEVMAGALSGGARATRDELRAALEAAGISAEGQRTPYLLQRAALDGILCQGPLQEGDPTYVLLDEWVPVAPSAGPTPWGLDGLARRYFSGHGPAAVQDFAWWAGLPMAEARAAMEAAWPEQGPGEAHADEPSDEDAEPVAHLLPPFDEFLLGYRDRSASLRPSHASFVNAGGGMPRPTVIVDGEVVGVWSRKGAARGFGVVAETFSPIDEGPAEAVRLAGERLGAFLERDVRLTLRTRGEG